MKITNHRLLKPHETIRKGDLYTRRSDLSTAYFVNASIGSTPETHDRYANWNFWRRRHTKFNRAANRVVEAADRAVRAANATHTKAVPIVSFWYSKHNKRHDVQVISLDETYLTGLDIGYKDGKATYQFKKFLRGRIVGPIGLTSYLPVK